MSEQMGDGITVKDIPKGTSEGDPETRWAIKTLNDIKIVLVFSSIKLFFRISEQDRDQKIPRDDEFSDSEDEGEGGRRNRDDYKNGKIFSDLAIIYRASILFRVFM